MGRYAKFIAAIVGGTCTALVSVFGADTTVGKVATVLLAAVTAASVYLVPNSKT